MTLQTRIDEKSTRMNLIINSEKKNTLLEKHHLWERIRIIKKPVPFHKRF